MAILFTGVYYRKIKTKHIKLMGTGIIWDLILILQIELTRHAINTASKALTNPMILNIHVSFSVLTVLLYFTIIPTGLSLKKGNENIRKTHRFLGVTTLTSRTLVFITSIMVYFLN